MQAIGLIDGDGRINWPNWKWLDETNLKHALRHTHNSGTVTTRNVFAALDKAGLKLPLSDNYHLIHGHTLAYGLGSALEKVTTEVVRARAVVSVAEHWA